MSNSRPFAEVQLELLAGLIPESSDSMSKDDYIKLVLEAILRSERLRHGYEPEDAQGARHVDQLTLERLRTWDSDDPVFSTCEKIFRRMAEGRNKDAFLLLEVQIQQRERQIAQTQKEKRSRPNKTHPIDPLIEEIVRVNRNITWKELLKSLEDRSGGGVIQSITDETIVPEDRKFKPIMISGLSNRLTAVRRKINCR
jgi:hypothetical protein